MFQKRQNLFGVHVLAHRAGVVVLGQLFDELRLYLSLAFFDLFFELTHLASQFDHAEVVFHWPTATLAP